MPGIVPARVVLYRLTHYLNLPDIVQRGMFCATHPDAFKDAVIIGNPDLITGRGSRVVPVAPGGVLNDYVPFYLGPHSPMLLDIKTGFHVEQRPQREIVYVCSELSLVQALGLPFAFTDGHAYMKTSRFFNAPDNLNLLDWAMIPAKYWAAPKRTTTANAASRPSFSFTSMYLWRLLSL